MVGCLSAGARGFSQYIPTLVGILERTSYEVRDEGLNFAYLYAGKYHERDHVRLTDDDADCLRGVETGRQKTPLLIVVEHLPKKRHVPINKFKVPRPDTTANSSTPVQPDTDICGIRQCALSASEGGTMNKLKVFMIMFAGLVGFLASGWSVKPAYACQLRVCDQFGNCGCRPGEGGGEGGGSGGDCWDWDGGGNCSQQFAIGYPRYTRGVTPRWPAG